MGIIFLSRFFNHVPSSFASNSTLLKAGYFAQNDNASCHLARKHRILVVDFSFCLVRSIPRVAQMLHFVQHDKEKSSLCVAQGQA